MPLDSGEVAANRNLVGAADQIAGLRPVKVVLSPDGHVGSALRAAREALLLGEDDIAQATRVRPAHIAAIERFDFAALPARPFVVGYVRAYAQALGLNAEAVVARFHAEAPIVDGKLRAPGGVRRDALGGVRWLLLSGAVIIGAVMIWNLARRAELRAAEPDKAPTRIVASAPPVAGPAQIGAPLPTPPEATTPPVYVTPGLEAPGTAKAGSTDASRSAAANATGALTDAAPGTVGPRFVPGSTVYGAPPSDPGPVLQARKSTTLVVRGPGGSIYFARLLAPGEAWRAPSLDGLSAEVAEPSSVEVFVGGASRGRLTQVRTDLSRLGEP